MLILIPNPESRTVLYLTCPKPNNPNPNPKARAVLDLTDEGKGRQGGLTTPTPTLTSVPHVRTT